MADTPQSSFRLSKEARKYLRQIAKTGRMSMTAVVEALIRDEAHRQSVAAFNAAKDGQQIKNIVLDSRGNWMPGLTPPPIIPRAGK